MREIAVVKARLECPVADLLERRARDFVAKLDLDQREARGCLRKEVGKPDETRIGQRAHPHMPGNLAFHRPRLPVQRRGIGEDLGGFGKKPLASRR